MSDRFRLWKWLATSALFGGIGGAINAWLCLARIPVPVYEDPAFNRLVVPGGAIHGAALAVVPAAASLVVAHWRLPFRLLLAPVVGWLGGYTSWIPLDRWVFEEPWATSLAWPFHQDDWIAITWTTFPYFGLVAVVYFLALVLPAVRRHQALLVAAPVSAGMLGSLWFWIMFGPWYFALIHGTVWGAATGAAQVVTRRRDERGRPGVNVQ